MCTIILMVLYSWSHCSSPSIVEVLPSAVPLQAMAAPDIEALLNGPASPPPLGVESNLSTTPYHITEVLIAEILGLFFTTLAVSIRIYTKRYINRKVDWEDCKSPRHSPGLETTTSLTLRRCVSPWMGNRKDLPVALQRLKSLSYYSSASLFPTIILL